MFQKPTTSLSALIRPPTIAASSSTAMICREILTLYDRWNRADKGGFSRIVKSIIAVWEDLEVVQSIPGKGTVWLEKSVLESSITNLRKTKLTKLISEGETCIASLERTRDACDKLVTDRADVRQYLRGMSEGMSRLIAMRRKILHALEHEVVSFSSQFNLLSLFLVMISETSEDYIPRVASDRALPCIVAHTLEKVQEEARADILFPEDSFS
jgi:hypothetical protein